MAPEGWWGSNTSYLLFLGAVMDSPLVSSLHDVGTSQDPRLKPQHGKKQQENNGGLPQTCPLHKTSLLQAKPSCANDCSTTGRNCDLGKSIPSLLSRPAMLCDTHRNCNREPSITFLPLWEKTETLEVFSQHEHQCSEGIGHQRNCPVTKHSDLEFSIVLNQMGLAVGGRGHRRSSFFGRGLQALRKPLRLGHTSPQHPQTKVRSLG